MTRPAAPWARASALALALVAFGPLEPPALAQDRAISYTFYGTPGLLEMPSALSADEGEFTGTLSFFGGQLRNSVTVQVTDRFSGTFRYSGVRDYLFEGDPYYDRSFDLRFRFNDEGRVAPAVAVGLQDFLGTGVYSGEYVVATKTVGDAFRVTTGLGWGRFGSFGGFSNPLGVIDDRFETRPDTFAEGQDTGGTPGVDAFFRGDAALFGGVEYAPTPRLILKAEYSSDDAYRDVRGEPLFDRASPLNFGVTYRPLPGIQLTGAYLYGTQLGFAVTVSANANQRPFGSGLDDPPPPVAVRADALRAARSWDRAAQPPADVVARLRDALAAEGITLVAVEIDDRAARVRFTNDRYRADAQALGRAARVLTREMPPSVDSFTLESVKRGIPVSAVTLARADLEALENEVGGTLATLDRAVLADAGGDAGLAVLPPVADRFSVDFGPYANLSFFQDGPVDVTAGVELAASYRIRPNLILSGSVRQRLLPFGEQDYELITDDEVPVVRRNARLYGADGLPVIRTLQLAYYSRPGRDLYGRVTAGYLERQFGGLSTELLWKPVTSPLGVGVEVNYARQRDFDQLFGFGDYDVVTGHASAYYDFGNGFQGEVDAGRYLAGDWGATFRLDREWENGWRVGGYFTLTDIPFEDYGEGSFDKGVSLSIPLDFIRGRPTRRSLDVALSSLNRDGGERLAVDGRLYDVVREGHYADLEDSWGRFWR